MKNISQIVEDFKKLKIAVIGDIMLDRTSWGTTSDRKNPENKEGKEFPIIHIQKEEFYLGGAGNVARNLIALGASCDFYGVFGNDLYGRELIRMCEKENIGIENLYLIKYPTIVKARHFIDGEYNERNDIGEKDENGRSLLKKIDKNLEERFLISFKNKCKIKRDYNGIILSDYDKHIFSKSFSKGIIEIAQKYGLPIFADVKPENLDYFKNCTLICPNTKEAQEMTGINYSKENLDLMGKNIQEKIGSKYVVITCSKDGAYIYDNGNSKLIDTQARKVVEVTGAGDTFISTLSLGMASGLDIYDSVEIANWGAGIVVEKSGTAIVKPEELIKRMKSIF
jgi:rfaE bifunctional protein kinase chain/domain